MSKYDNHYLKSCLILGEARWGLSTSSHCSELIHSQNEVRFNVILLLRVFIAATGYLQ